MKDSVHDVEIAFLLNGVKDKPFAVGWFIEAAGLFAFLPFVGGQCHL